MSYIGVFDSGIGGLTILNALRQQFPSQSFVYKADSKNFPYGNKETKSLISILKNNLASFADADAVIVACSTLSLLLPQIETKTPSISMVEGILKSFSKESTNIKSVGILATLFTVEQSAYPKLLKKYNPKLSIIQNAAPDLASAIETEDPKIDSILESYLSLFPQDIDAIILACTHYNVLINTIKKQRPRSIIINPYEGIFELVTPYIKTNNSSITRFLTNHPSEKLASISKTIFGTEIDWEYIYE